MAEYYLISQLPSLDGMGENAPVPITEERFMELCGRLLGKRAFDELSRIKLIPPMELPKSSSNVIKEWNENERNLRLVLAKVRADKLGKTFDLQNQYLPQELFKAANTATEMENPLQAEKFLLQHRLAFLETIRPADNFSEEFIFYYALKLKLTMRIRQFDAKAGETAYKNIYNSVLNRDRLEA